MAKKKTAKPKIRHMCSVGTLGGYGGKNGEWDIPKKLKRIKQAGFDGFLGRIPMITREHVDQSGLIFAATDRRRGGSRDQTPVSGHQGGSEPGV